MKTLRCWVGCCQSLLFCSSLHSQLSLVKKQGRCGFVKTQLQEVISCQYVAEALQALLILNERS